MHGIRRKKVRGALAAAVGLGVVAGLATLTSGTAVAGTERGKAPTVTYLQVSAGSVTKVSSKHHRKLRVSMYASKSTAGKPSISVTVGLPNGRESHTWRFNLPKKGISISAKGSGHVKVSGAKTAHFLVASLKVTGKGHTHKSKCQGQLVGASRKATVSGTFLVDTKAAWGKVGSTKQKMHFATTSTVYWSYANTATCPTPPVTNACAASTSWSLSKSTATSYVSMYGGQSGKRAYVSGSRSVQLSKPAGASRSDFVTAAKAKKPKLTVHGDNTAVMKAFAGKGSATLTATTPAPPSLTPCGTGSKQESSQTWFGDGIHQNSPPAALPAKIYGAIKVPNSGFASFSKVKVVS
jgi:hypothetical protein